MMITPARGQAMNAIVPSAVARLWTNSRLPSRGTDPTAGRPARASSASVISAPAFIGTAGSTT